MVPVNVTVSVPLPLTPVRPASVASVRMPFWTASVSVSSTPASSDSVMALPLAALKTKCRVLVGHLRVVDVAERDGKGATAGADRRGGGEAARAVADQHADIVAVDVRDQGVEVAVAVDVAERDGTGAGCRRRPAWRR